MAKDPAILFYTSDFLMGVMFMTMEERGKYITILCLLHQHGGKLPLKTIEFSIGKLSENLLSKFIIDEKGMIYNKRLLEEIEKRSLYCESRRINRSKKISKSYVKDIKKISPIYLKHMENENEDENEIENEYIIFEKNVLNEWNILCNEYPILNKIIKISGSRRKHLKQRFAEKTFIITDIIKALKEQPKIINGLKYKEGGEWRVSFDWIIANDNNYIKILERRYKGDDANAMPSFIRTK